MLPGMRAFRFNPRVHLDDLGIAELSAPTPGPRDILLKMRAAALNHRDLLIATGRYGDFAAPLVPLSDGAGEVVARGAEVTRFAVGDLAVPAYVRDWVSGPPSEASARRRLGGPDPGVLAELVVVPEDAAVRAPAHLSPIEAATLPIAAVTAWQLLFEDARLRPGELVAVRGTGGVSLFVLQLARAAGARVVVLVRSEERAARVEAMGAIAVDTARLPSWESRLLDLSRGRGVDVFVDLIGGDDLARAVSVTRVGGTVGVVGFVAGAAATLDLPSLIRRSITLRAVSGGSRASFEALVRAMEAQRIHPVVDAVFPFARAKEAYQRIAAGHLFGKVVVSFDEVPS
jgi:NADPH:quinone reductase-like Zn-dependent oxidoreductase